MKRRRTLTLMLLLLTGGIAMAYEEPEYEVLERTSDYEIRRYAPYIVAEVDTDGNVREAGNKAFRILAGYIFGDNQGEEKMNMTAPVEARERRAGTKMEMTAPVTASPDDGDGYVYAFVMERKYSLETLPKPNDPRIRILQVEPRTMAVLRYSGRWTDSNDRKHTAELRDRLEADGIEIVGEPVLARYNAPFTPWFLRRNEVLFQVDWPRTNN